MRNVSYFEKCFLKSGTGWEPKRADESGNPVPDKLGNSRVYVSYTTGGKFDFPGQFNERQFIRTASAFDIYLFTKSTAQEAQLALNQISDVIIDTTRSVNYAGYAEDGTPVFAVKDADFTFEPQDKSLTMFNGAGFRRCLWKICLVNIDFGIIELCLFLIPVELIIFLVARAKPIISRPLLYPDRMSWIKV